MANAYTRPSVPSSGVTFAQLQALGWAGHVEKLLAALPQPGSPNAAPTSAPTSAASADAGSTLPTATYYAVQTETNGLGETTPGPATAGTAITSGTNHLTLTTTATLKSGNTAANLYIGTSSTGPFYLAAAGIAANTAVNIAAPITGSFLAVAPPTANTTALTAKEVELIRSAKTGNFQAVIGHLHDVVTPFLRGNPVSFGEAIDHLQEADTVVSVLYKAIGEIGALLVANPGTITNSTDPIGVAKKVRTWP